jgi:hypothetical protein
VDAALHQLRIEQGRRGNGDAEKISLCQYGSRYGSRPSRRLGTSLKLVSFVPNSSCFE